MKQRRKLNIKHRIFKLDDLRRIANVFNEEAKLATESNHHYSVNYSIHFADDSSLESELPSVLENDLVEIKRPIKVEFDFNNYALNRGIIFSVHHGISDYGNGVFISAKDGGSWLNDNFKKIEDLILGALPQNAWFLKYSTIIGFLLAFGIGSLFFFVLENILLLTVPDKAENLHGDIFNNYTSWLFKVFIGFVFGAFDISKWFLSAWPNIELDFGPEHLKEEKKKRERIFVVITVIFFPILLSMLQGLIKSWI